MKSVSKSLLASALVASGIALTSGAYAQAIKVAKIVELSGGGTTAGTMYRNGARLAFNEINAAGGIMGRKVEIAEMDTQSQPAVAKAMTVKSIDDKTDVIFGPVFSGSILVSMTESQRAGIPNFTGGEAANLTQQGNPFLFRSSFSQSMGMPKVANYLANDL
ncbi:MAG: amino acid ABC transporter substrate-binding protein, partial [Betaproteobacteria bacterium]